MTEPKSFLGLCDVFRQFVPNSARTTAPLNLKLGEDRHAWFGKLNNEKLTIIEKLQGKVMLPPALALLLGRCLLSHVTQISWMPVSAETMKLLLPIIDHK